MKRFTTLLLLTFAMFAFTDASAATTTQTAVAENEVTTIAEAPVATVDAVTAATEIQAPAAEQPAKTDKKKSDAANYGLDLDEDNNEKMGVEIKEKRQSDEFIDTDHVTKLLIAFIINLIATIWVNRLCLLFAMGCEL